MSHSYGDLVLLSRGRAVLVTVLTSPPPSGDLYQLDLPISGQVRQFGYDAPGTDTINDVADGLLAVLLDQQTVYSVAITTLPLALMVVGPPGEVFDVTCSANLLVATVEEAVSSSRTRPVRVLASKSIWTRTHDRETVAVERLVGRELDDHEPFGFDGADVMVELGKERYSG